MASQDHPQAPADGSNAATPANQGGVNPQQQGTHEQTKPHTDSQGHHGGNHGNDANDAGARPGTAQGSSHRGDMPNADSKNTGGGSDKEHKNQPKNTTDSTPDYKDGNAAPSSANNGGKIGDADNSV